MSFTREQITCPVLRPEESQRCAAETAVYRLLHSLEIDYIMADHPPAATIEDCQAVDEALQTNICKNLFLCNAGKTCFYLLMLPGEKVFKTKDLSGQIGSSRLSFAPAAYMEQYLFLRPGSVSVLGLMNDVDHHVHLLVDADLLQEEYIGCHPCVNTTSLKIGLQDILQKFLPAVEHEYTVVSL